MKFYPIFFFPFNLVIVQFWYLEFKKKKKKKREKRKEKKKVQ